ncbi:MAG: hypothetical protein KC502_11160 [Myxococcales bacterium]|nr:hypothetical protein [Myxococcales bacterium]
MPQLIRWRTICKQAGKSGEKRWIDLRGVHCKKTYPPNQKAEAQPSREPSAKTQLRAHGSVAKKMAEGGRRAW